MDFVLIVLLLLVILVVLPIGAVFAFSPQTIVRLQARFYRTAYKEILKQPDEAIDKPYQMPWDRASMGKRSEFIVKGDEHPESYTKLTRYYRALGVFWLILFGCSLVSAFAILLSRP
jgi:hypothetical protein